MDEAPVWYLEGKQDFWGLSRLIYAQEAFPASFEPHSNFVGWREGIPS